MRNEIFDYLPSHLHLAHNKNGSDNDKWRIYNTVSKTYVKKTGATTIYKCMKKFIKLEDEQRRAWLE